ncbi:hypothetical protein [Mycoplasmopsis cynos]|uniref:hypothetical protein n=1 Tax=Mycoplasmopsis cynos TaxID=171284 RepID=UPI0022062EAB|nr:hypothetical protein [Mycoplasmopsis cynos]UWV93094.1 hypothetical protein NWE57_04710 [Mycoplasmopsis cynos]
MNIVGFSARVLNNQQKPKYLNSPETKLFNKSQILYNFFNAKEHIEKKRSNHCWRIYGCYCAR